jgi:hypothetical protein
MASNAWLTEALAGVSVATQALGLLEPITHEAWIGHKPGGYAEPDFAVPVTRLALVQEGTNQKRTLGGDVITVRACISFLDPIAPNGAEGRREPVDPRDRITLRSGLTGPIVDAPGSVIDTETGRRVLSVFWMK